MAKHDSDIPNDAERSDAERRPSTEDGPVPDAHRGKPDPRPDSHSRNAPDADMARPDQQEELGPVEGLLHASAVEAKAEITDDPEAEAEASRLGVEGENVEAAQIFGLLLATAVALALAVVGVFVLVAYYSDAETMHRSSGMAYPEIQELQNRATERLTQYGRSEDAYRMPVTDAMALVAADYAARGADARPAPEHYRTVYLGSYFGQAHPEASPSEASPSDASPGLEADGDEAVAAPAEGESEALRTPPADETSEADVAEEPEDR